MVEEKIVQHFETNYTEFNPNSAANSFELVNVTESDRN